MSQIGIIFGLRLLCPPPTPSRLLGKKSSSFLEARCPGPCLMDVPALPHLEKTPACLQITMATLSFGPRPACPVLPGTTGAGKAPQPTCEPRTVPAPPFLPLSPGTWSTLRICSQHHTLWESKQRSGVPFLGKDQHVLCPGPASLWGSFCAFWQSSRVPGLPTLQWHRPARARCWEVEHCCSLFALFPSFQL